MITSNDILNSHLSLFVKKNVLKNRSKKDIFLFPSFKNWFIGVVTFWALLSGIQQTYAQSASTVTIGGTSSINSISNNVATFVDEGLTISANGNITNFAVMITGSYTPGDNLSYNGTLPSGVTPAAFNTTTRSLNFTGTASASNWQTFLRTVRLQTASATCFPESRQVAFVAGGALYNPLNGHFYNLSPSSTSWSQGATNANNQSYFGLQGYMATLTSSAENSYASVLLASDSWIGASDDYLNINAAVGYNLYANQTASEGKFYWVTGPEKGTQISTSNGTFLSTVYQNYAGGEPNNSGGEHVTELYVASKQWNDMPNGANFITVQEFGGMSTDILSSTIVFSRNIYVNGAPTSGISGGGVSVCSGVNSTVLALNGFAGTVVRWERSSDNFITTTNTVSISNTSTSYTVSNITQTTYYRAIVNTVGNTCTNLATSPVAVNVAAANPGNLNSLNSTICANGYAEINLFGANGTVVRWEKSTTSNFAAPTTIANTSTFLSDQLTTTGTMYYRALVAPTCGSNVYTSGYPITVVAGTPPVGGSVNNVTACEATVTGSLTLSGYSGSISKWQNSSDGVVWADLTANSSTTQSYSALNAQKYYRAVLTNGSCGTAYSSGGFINFNAYFSGTLSALVSTTSQMTASNTGGTWSSSNTAVATVSSSGLVTAQSVGSANITYTNGGTSCVKAFTVSTYTCGAVESRNNGNSLASSCPGVGGAISTNFTSTAYATVPATAKTADLYLNWVAGIPTDNAGNKIVPAISQIYMNGVSTITQTGPAGTAVTSGGSGFKSPYCFYTQNLPTSGTYTLKLVNPVNGITLNTCTYVGSTLQTNTTTTTPTLSQNTTPTFVTPPSNISSACAGANNGPVVLTVQDTESSLNTLVITATSSNTTLLPNTNITITQPNSTGAASFNYTPVLGQTGSTVITLTATDEQGLTSTTTVTINVTASTLSAVSNAVNDLACGTTASGSLTTTVTGGTGHTYQWSWSSSVSGTYSTVFTSPLVTPAPSFSPTNLLGGYYYRLTVTDACGTTMTATPVQLNSVTAMTIAATSSTNNCYGVSNGAITVTTTGGGTSQVLTAVSGSNTYTQSVSTFTSPNRTFVLSNLPAGTYTVSVADANSSCNPSISVTITQQMAPLTILGDGCAYKTSFVTTAGQTSYTWYKDDVAISGATNNTYTPTIVGVYKVQVLNGTCATLSTPTSIYTCGVTPTGSMSPFATSTTIISREGAKNNGEGIDQRGKILTQPFVYGTVTTATGRIWMDRNLGASRVALSSTDDQAYGDYYQWGRLADGHQTKYLTNNNASGFTNAKSSSSVPSNDLWIVPTDGSNDWLVTADNTLWTGSNPANNPCPTGFRIPTEAEWEAERVTWTSNNAAGAFASPLKLTRPGILTGFDSNGASYTAKDNFGQYHTQTAYSNGGVRYFGIEAGNAWFDQNYFKSNGMSCRCIKD